MDREAWRAAIHGVAKSRTRLSDWTELNDAKLFFLPYPLFLSLLLLVANHVWLFWDPMDCIAHQTPLSLEFSRQEYCSELPFPSLRDLLDPGIEPRSPVLQADSLLSEPPGKPYKDVMYFTWWKFSLIFSCDSNIYNKVFFSKNYATCLSLVHLFCE